MTWRQTGRCLSPAAGGAGWGRESVHLALPHKPNLLSDSELASLLSRQAASLAEQLKADAADLRDAGRAEVAERVEGVVVPLRRLARAAETNTEIENRDA